MRGKFFCFAILGLLLIMMGCGGEEKITEAPPVLDLGLSGSSYLNTKFSCKIIDLPVDDWTIKTYGNDGQGIMIYNESELGISSNMLLLMEPVPANQFIDVDEGNYFDSIHNAKMPFITVWAYRYVDMDIPNHEFLEIMRTIYADSGLKEAKPVAGANCTGYQVTGQYDDYGTITLSWFVKKNIIVEIGYVAENDKHISYIGTYNHVVSHLTMMGL